jgi:hypothetical protein
MTVTRTLGPIHFEDLEPRRFEDLVRQLIYDFRVWRRLEATGRAGSDDGFDARGFEVGQPLGGEQSSDEVDSDADGNQLSDRLWLLQCKREQRITPAKLSAYLDDIVLSPDEPLHGLMLVAPCDFSKRSRDTFAERCRSLGVREWFLWGKAELEDLLFRPQNDHLLFAYFGVSLTIRNRTKHAQLRSRLAIKRKAKRVLDEFTNRPVLVRSIEDEQYPHERDVPNFRSNRPWMVVQYGGMMHQGLLFTHRRYFAYIDDAGESWDAALILNDAVRHRQEDPWADEIDSELRQRIYDAWASFPRRNQAWVEVQGLIPFENVIEIDEIGDEVVATPHLFVRFTPDRQPFVGQIVTVETTERWDSRRIHPSSADDRRAVHFPEEWRQKLPPEP